MQLSYIIVTHNRCQALTRTLTQLNSHTPMPAAQWEVWVVNNASTDDTAEVLRRDFADINVISRQRNEGVAARNYGIEAARGKYIVLLDDDSYPVDAAVTQSIDYLEANAQTAAVVGRVILPDGSLEACAMPAVMLSGAVCIRKSVLDEVGGFRREFFRKAGEYDLSFRIWQAGYRIERFEDIVYRHDKIMTGRSSALAHRMDLRNNLILVERYLPHNLRSVYRADWKQRYTAIARHAGQAAAARCASLEARWWALREMVTGRNVLDKAAIETLFELNRQAELIANWAQQHNLCRVVIADFAKNIYATWRGCRKAALQVTAIADNNEAFADLKYRDLPIVPDAQAMQTHPQGVVVSNINPAQIDGRITKLGETFDGPVLRLWQARTTT